MKALVYRQYGSPDVLRHEDVAQPTPKENEVLVKVHASSVNAADVFIIRGSPFPVRMMTGGILKPGCPVPGTDVAGEVMAVGDAVHDFRVGDRVFGDLSNAGWRAYAEYVSVRETALVRMPEGVAYEQCGAVPLAGGTALQGLRKADIRAGQRVLVNGAGGGVGAFGVQLAQAFGAEVTGVCSARKQALVAGLGAVDVIDYARQDVTQLGQTYDVILDCAAHRPYEDYRKILADGGTYVLVGGATARIFALMLRSAWASRGGRRFVSLMAKPDRDDLVTLGDLLASGKLNAPIYRQYGLSDAPEALREFEAGNVAGKAVISVA